MEKEICRNCAHFRQHYAMDKREIFRVYCGHCVRHSVKIRKPDAAACEDFIASSPDENAFAIKKYYHKH